MLEVKQQSGRILHLWWGSLEGGELVRVTGLIFLSTWNSDTQNEINYNYRFMPHSHNCDLPGFIPLILLLFLLPSLLPPSFLLPNIMHTFEHSTQHRSQNTDNFYLLVCILPYPPISYLLIDSSITLSINLCSSLRICFSHIYAHFLTVYCLGIFFLIYKRAPCCSQSFVFVIALQKFHSICCLELYFIHFDCCTLFRWVHTLKWIDLCFHSSSSGNLGGLCKSSLNRKYGTRTRAVDGGWRREGRLETWR